MKIEKISETQIKFVLTNADLSERNIKMTELAYGSEKAQELFREMMEQAFVECAFESDNMPLMIEAIPMTADSIVIIVTKVTAPEQIEERFNMLPKQASAKKRQRNAAGKKAKDINEQPSNISVFSFDTLDDVTLAANRMYMQFNGMNMLFKNNNRYFLYVENNCSFDNVTTEYIDSVLAEYGQKHLANTITRYYLAEHGEIIIKSNAIRKLALL